MAGIQEWCEPGSLIPGRIPVATAYLGVPVADRLIRQSFNVLGARVTYRLGIQRGPWVGEEGRVVMGKESPHRLDGGDPILTDPVQRIGDPL